MYTYICIYIYQRARAPPPQYPVPLHSPFLVHATQNTFPHLGLYTFLPLPILYDVQHSQGGSWGGSYIAQ